MCSAEDTEVIRIYYFFVSLSFCRWSRVNMICKMNGFPKHASVNASLKDPWLGQGWMFSLILWTWVEWLAANAALFSFYSVQLGFCFLLKFRQTLQSSTRSHVFIPECSAAAASHHRSPTSESTQLQEAEHLALCLQPAAKVRMSWRETNCWVGQLPLIGSCAADSTQGPING